MFNFLPNKIRSLETKAAFKRALHDQALPNSLIIMYLLILLILCCVANYSCIQDLHENLFCVHAAYPSKIKFTTTTTGIGNHLYIYRQ